MADCNNVRSFRQYQLHNNTIHENGPCWDNDHHLGDKVLVLIEGSICKVESKIKRLLL